MSPTKPKKEQLSEDERFPLFALLKANPIPLILLSEDEIYNLADAKLIQALQEDDRIERKPAGIHAEHLGNYFNMWSNTPANGGLIAVGIDDDGGLSGCIKADIQHINDLQSRAGGTYCPDARYNFKKVLFNHPDGTPDYLLLFRVKYHESRVIRNNKGQVFARFGDKKKQLNADQIRELEIDKGQLLFEQDPTTLEYPADFDIQLIKECADRFRKSKELPSDSLTDEEILELLFLGKIKKERFLPNNACVIVFAKHPREVFPGCRIRFFRFEGEEEGTGEKFTPQKDIWIDMGSIPYLVREAERVLDSQLRTFTRLGKNNRFQTTPEYPRTAWYEALVNACVHRSYSLRNMNIFVKMFDDRIEIESPGGFPPLVTPENIYTSHNPRNPRIFDAMQYLGFVVGAREGTRRMRKSMLDMKLPLPEFIQRSETYNTVLVTLRNDYKHRKVLLDSDVAGFVGEVIFKTLSQDEKRAINFIAEHGEISVSDLQRITKRSWHSARNLLVGLVKRSILLSTHRVEKVKKSGRDTAARYTLNR
jgi:ATP-dependent DNA helicase RecG